MIRTLLLSALLLWTGLALAGEPAPPPETDEAPPGGDFTLQSAAGPVALAGLRGKVVMLYFGYTTCPDVCPTSLAAMTAALKALAPEELAQVQPLFVSVDPKRDTPERLKPYVEYFHPAFIGVTGSDAEMAEVAQLYGAKYYEATLAGSALGYAVNHSAAVYLIAPNGELRFVFPHLTSPSVMVEAMQYLLKGN